MKIIPIMLEFFYRETVKDIKRIFESLTSEQTYVQKAIGFKNIFKIFTTPKYLCYWSFFIFIIALIKFHWYVQILTGFLFLVMYFRKLWISGAPINFYKKKYF